jgi:hypothetical protein
MLDAEFEKQDLFIHRQHSEGATFIAPIIPQYPDSYRVRDNDRRLTVQAQFSGPQERRGRIQEHRLQLKFHAELCIQKHSLDNPKYVPVGFMPGSAFGYPQNFNRF